MIAFYALLGCVHTGASEAPRPALVELRPEPAAGLADGLHLDAGLRAAAEELVGDVTRVDARLDPASVRLALARAGYPRDAHFIHAHSDDGTLPRTLLDSIPRTAPVDIAWASRPTPGGIGQTFILGWATQAGTMDALPRDIPLDRGLPLRIDDLASPRLYIGAPDGRAQELGITPGVDRWLDVFHIPGEYRIEIVDKDRVAFLFSLFVDVALPAPSALPGPAERPDPLAASAEIAANVNALRARTGLRPLRAFPLFEPETRAQAACLASLGIVAHKTAGCPGVPDLTAHDDFPHARHHEDVVAADTAAEAWDRLYDSPGHRLNLLCDTCTHLTVGSAIENTNPARVYAVVEALEFPDGEPAPIVRGRE